MKKENELKNIHPGEILKDFLNDLNISAYKLAKQTNLNQSQISQILKGKRSITIKTSIELSKIFGPSPEYWMILQISYDLMEEKRKH